MEEQSGDYWEMEENRSEEDNRGKMCWLLDKGIIGLGKKLLFTGFVISSAPLALPPLVVISAIGIVVSIPSGIFLASYACSEKLMRMLLPIPEQEEVEEEAIGVKRKIEEMLEDKNVDVAEEENGIVEVSVESDRERVLEEPVVVEEIVEEKTDKEKEKEKENGVEDKEIEKGSVEETKNEGKPADEDKTTREISTSKDNQSATSASKGDQSAVTTTAELPVSHGTEETKDQAGISSVKADPSNNEAKKKKTSVKKKPVASAQQPQTQKVLYNEEEIWKQIEAVRKIVGYKASVQKTSIEELKALYIFTGVEPPASFKEPSDLADVNNKLHFLKSIIGVN